MGKYEEAQQALEKARDLAADSEKAMRADILAYLAMVQYQRGDFEGSAATCDQMLDVKNSKEGYFLRGTAYLHLDQYDKAASDLEKWLQIPKSIMTIWKSTVYTKSVT